MLKRNVFLLLALIVGGSSYAQYNPQFMVPYKSGRFWGWSDTLGNVLVEPKYNHAAFFKYEYKDDQYLAVLGKGNIGFYYVKPNGELLFPSGYKYFPENRYDYRIEDELIAVINNVYKMGLFSRPLDKMVVDGEQNRLATYYYDQIQYAIFKEEREKYYKILNIKREIQETEIVDFKVVDGQIVYTDSKNRRGFLKGDKLDPMSEEEYKKKIRVISCPTEFLHPFPPSPWLLTFSSFNIDNEKVRSFIETVGIEPINVCTDGDEYYYIVKTDNKEGVLLQSGEVFVPIEFEKVKYNHTNGFSLQKNVLSFLRSE